MYATFASWNNWEKNQLYSSFFWYSFLLYLCAPCLSIYFRAWWNMGQVNLLWRSMLPWVYRISWDLATRTKKWSVLRTFTSMREATCWLSVSWSVYLCWWCLGSGNNRGSTLRCTQCKLLTPLFRLTSTKLTWELPCVNSIRGSPLNLFNLFLVGWAASNGGLSGAEAHYDNNARIFTFPSMIRCKSLIETRSCCIVSRSRMVTVWSSSVWWSTVTE